MRLEFMKDLVKPEDPNAAVACGYSCEDVDADSFVLEEGDKVVELDPDYWEALVTLTECEKAFKHIIKRDDRLTILTRPFRTDIESLLAQVAKLTNQYDLGLD